MYGSFKTTLLDTLKAISPVVVIVLMLQFILLDMPASMVWRFLFGAVLVFFGLSLFLIGVKVSIRPMGDAIGSALPQIGNLPLALFWIFFLGLTATLAEPPVRVLAEYIKQTSGGEIESSYMILFMALGVGLFLAIAVLRMAFRIPMRYIFWGGYTLILLLSFFVPPDYLAISFDGSGVTTGPVTVPVILSLGIGITAVLGDPTYARENFGLVGVASIGPVLLIMLMGVIVG